MLAGRDVLNNMVTKQSMRYRTKCIIHPPYLVDLCLGNVTFDVEQYRMQDGFRGWILVQDWLSFEVLQ